MKKVLVVALVLVSAVLGLFAESFVESSMGFGFLTTRETVSYGGASITGHEKSSALTVDLTAMTFAEGSKFGLDLGLSILFPLSQTVEGMEMDVEFFNCNWCPRIGVALRYEINSQLTMLSAAGYELMMNFDSAYQSGITIRSSLFVHGIYAQDRISYKVSEEMNVNAGLSVYLPIFGSQKLSATGYGSETYSLSFSGLLINPFIGIDISHR